MAMTMIIMDEQSTIEQMIADVEQRLQKLDAEADEINRKREDIRHTLEQFKFTLTALKQFRQNHPIIQAATNAVDKTELSKYLKGLTVPQKVILLGIMHDREFRIKEDGRLLHQMGELGGKWKNVASRLYHLAYDRPDTFSRTKSAILDILPGAEKEIPTHILKALLPAQEGVKHQNGSSMSAMPLN